MDKIQRATEIHRTMTTHQMALYIVDIDEICTRAAIRINELLEERNATGVAIDSATRGIIPEQHPILSRLQMIANMAKRITELQDALELAEEAVRAKQPEAQNGWQLVPVEPTRDMLIAINWPNNPTGYAIMLAAAPKLGGE